ncbi:hypothetical protein OPV22_007865 [Ensete ventricosum]|uniref:Cation-transporting P-type ATPase N-terminal domain-containing protein n=1 Tax=Ensete ventricosum TaxID=4639 RepID=A0AAV8RC18_ENSVE|nr:hypothetical protein OPV22_007865 [Ensete ventricosum]
MGGDKAISLDEIKNETVDLERIPIEEVFEQLKCTREGLSSTEGANRLQIFGPNKLEEKKESKLLKFLGFMWNPLSWVMEMAAIMAIALANGDGKPPDWQDFVGIVVLLVINSTISFIEENNAGNAAAALMAGLAPKTKVLRDGRWNEEDAAILVPARASRTENQDAIDAAMVGMLADPKEARAGIREVHFLPFNPVDKRTALTYIDADGNWHRVSKGAPEQILSLCNCKEDVRNKVHSVIDKFAERGLRSLAVARQEVPEKSKESPGRPWQFVGLLPLFDPPRHDSAETIRRALNLGVNVKMITGDQLAIAKETGRRLGMGTNMYPSSSLLGQNKDASIAALPVDELIEKADGFAGVFPEHKYEIVKKLQERKHICGMTGDGVNDAPALKKADIGIAVADATDAARSASDIVLTEPGLSVIISAVLTSRAIFQRMKNYTIYAVSITIRIVLGFMLIALIWKFDFSPFMVLIIAILNDGTIMTISKDRKLTSSLINLSWCFIERPGLLLVGAFIIAQLVATLIAVYANWGFARIKGIGWGWAGVIWLYSVVFFFPLDLFKFAIRYILSGKAWDNLLENKTAFTTKKDYEKSSYRELSEIAEQAKRRAEIARLRELNTLKGHVESVVKLKGLDIDNIQQHYTV